MDSNTSAGAARPRRNGSRALALVTLLASTWSAANAAPVLVGTPAGSVTAAHYYAFQPAATNTGGKRLTFAIANKPSWAQFDTSTGRLFGTPVPPTNVGTFPNIAISASDGASRGVLPAFAIRVLPLPKIPPVLSGAPATAVKAGQAYSFRPTARDPNGLRLAFVIANKPAWATFNTATGSLSGIPTAGNVGNYPNVTITVYDGYAKATLPAFSIVVSAASAGSVPSRPPVTPGSAGSATLSWTPPTQTTNGTPLTNLAGYRIYYGRTPNLGQAVTVANPGLTRYVMSGLTPATWYFALTAYDSAGVESLPTSVESLVMP